MESPSVFYGLQLCSFTQFQNIFKSVILYGYNNDSNFMFLDTKSPWICGTTFYEFYFISRYTEVLS